MKKTLNAPAAEAAENAVSMVTVEGDLSGDGKVDEGGLETSA